MIIQKWVVKGKFRKSPFPLCVALIHVTYLSSKNRRVLLKGSGKEIISKVPFNPSSIKGKEKSGLQVQPNEINLFWQNR